MWNEGDSEDRAARREAAKSIVDRALRAERGEAVEEAPPAYEVLAKAGGMDEPPVRANT